MFGKTVVNGDDIEIAPFELKDFLSIAEGLM
jgi:hypothetical protein